MQLLHAASGWEILSMEYELRKNLHFCSADGRLVFLDLERDRYFCLPDRLESTFRAWVSHETDKTDDIALRSLLKGNIISQASTGTSPQAAKITAPTYSLLDGYHMKSNVLTTAVAIRERLQCRALLKERPLLEVLASITKAHAPSYKTMPVHPKILTAAMAFEASNTWLAAKDQCLERSVALVRWLSRRQLHAQLVFGVTMSPFRAHAWAQADDLVLNDTVAKVSNYTPILVI